MDTISIIKSLASSELLLPSQEGGKSSLVFRLVGFTEEIGKKGAKAVVPVAISKRSVNSILEIINEITEEKNVADSLAMVKGTKVISLADKKIPGYGAWLEGREEMTTPEERQDFTKSFLLLCAATIEEQEKSVSIADPLSDVKRRFCKTGKYSDLLEVTDPSESVKAAITQEITELQKLMDKASEVSRDDYMAFLTERFTKNGVDEDGFVLLRGKKEDAAPVRKD